MFLKNKLSTDKIFVLIMGLIIGLFLCSNFHKITSFFSGSSKESLVRQNENLKNEHKTAVDANKELGKAISKQNDNHNNTVNVLESNCKSNTTDTSKANEIKGRMKDKHKEVKKSNPKSTSGGNPSTDGPSETSSTDAPNAHSQINIDGVWDAYTALNV